MTNLHFCSRKQYLVNLVLSEHQEEHTPLLLELPVVEPRHAIGDLEKPKTPDVNHFWQHVTFLE